MKKKSVVLTICLPFFWIGTIGAQGLMRKHPILDFETYSNNKEKFTKSEKLYFDLTNGENREELLSIVFSNFNALVTPAGFVLLSWNSYPESSNELYFIERSIDGINWIELAQYSGMGGGCAYSFLDDEPNLTKRYYRLKQLDVNGSFEYAQKTNLISSYNAQKSIKSNLKKKTKTYFSIQSDNKIERMDLYTQSGKLVYSEVPKANTVNIRMKTSSKEPCFVTIYAANSIVKRKLVVK
jgi:hypothetical protein